MFRFAHCLYFKIIEYENKGKHLQMVERGAQPKIYQATRVGFLLFIKIEESIPHDSLPTTDFSYQWVRK